MAKKPLQELLERDAKRDVWQEALDAILDIKAGRYGAVYQAARLAAFQSVFGAMNGKLSSRDEFMARKAEEKALEEKMQAGKTEFGGILQ